ncbi:T9SS type B sorting domain-containing protein [Algibacter mikhailovii]|uniref:T9SS type B sorting domain-containing protein n=1 Tax=Algibacter mikhailovii TaxID=425498 RepID=UPI002494B070|nr:T9SS type B sorting domain-containing protein [Algibacter mikhailovii]
MNRSTLQFVILFSLFSISGIAQNYKPFSIRKNIELKGNMVVIGNNILGQDNAPFNDLSRDNQDISMQYIDIDSDGTTFSSSSADVVLPDQPDGSPTTCYRAVYAGLYWSAILQSGDRSSINQVKFKLPNSTSYNNVIGEVVYDAIVDPIPSFSGEPDNTPYVCYADVSNLLSGLSDLEGTYTLANVTSSLGSNFSTGLAAGWTLVMIYENPNLNTKSFTVFDGFSHIYDSHTETIPISGFNTPPSGSIDIQMAYAALDGDRTKRATKMEIDGKSVTSSFRPANKFFGSVIENSDGVAHPRNPYSANTLGYDTGFLEIKNAEPEYVGNGDTTSGFTLQVARGQADPIFTFLNSFAVDVIAPDIVLTKIVTDDTGAEIDGADVVLGQRLFYEITYESVGNDNVINFTLKDVLPDNIFFDPDTDIDLSNAGGATLQSYDDATRTLIFNIPNSSVEIGDPKYVIRLATQVVSDCYDLSQACSNEITNQAFASYSGVINNTLVVDEGSFATTVCFGIPGSTNFLIDIENCNYQRDQVLCGSSVELVAADGYDSYSWSTSPTGTPVVGTDQTYTASNLGTYYVTNTTLSTCTSINEEISVIPYGSTLTNPIIPFADEVNICPNDGKSLPDIYLCGVNATRSINTGIADAVSIIWEKLDESSCSAVGVDDCANENSSCVWNQIATGPNYVSDTSGQFRIVINYPGGCFSIYYFNVYANLLAPTISAKDIICNTQGQVTAGGVPTDYEYSLDPLGPYQPSNVFAVSSPGYYTIYLRQLGVDSNPCVFETPSAYVRLRDVSITPNVIQPQCFGDKGTISVAVNDGLPQYNYSISLSGTLVNSSGLTDQSDYTFSNLNPGLYTIDISTDDSCIFRENIEIIEPANLEATSAITRPLTCEDGEITVYPVGGTAPYFYYVNSTTVFQNSPVIPVTASGTFNIEVFDSNNCSAQTSITINQIAEPAFDIVETDILCYGSSSGQLEFNVSNANGYSIEYSIDNGVTYTSNPTFSNLASGTYQALIRYTLNTTQCISTSKVVAVSEPPVAVTASAGVSQLAGCGPSGEGAVRITNPQGGVPPYEYSFDSQGSWTTTNEAFLAPGTYTLYVRDSNSCVFPMTDVTIDQEPIAPTIAISDPDFNCDGSGNSTVTITNSGGDAFLYTYLLDNVENPNTTDPTVFLDVPNGDHIISVKYELQTVPSYSNLLFEDFGSGPDVSSPGINSAFCFERQVEATKCNGDERLGNGEYTVTNRLKGNIYEGWHNPIDHTSGSAQGRYLAVDAGSVIPNNAVLYRKTIGDIIPNQPIQVRFYATNLLKLGNTQPDASLTVELQDTNGTPLSSESTGGIPKTNGWVEYNRTINPGNNTTLDFVLRLEVSQTDGIDFAVDDIQVFQLPTACTTQRDFPINIESGKAFSPGIMSATNVSCEGAADGTITVVAENFNASYGFQYSLDGSTWITANNSPHTITGLDVGTYNIGFRYDAIATACNFSFSQSIMAPEVLTVTATATPITCLKGAEVRANAAGGTPAYGYELLDTAFNLVANFPSSGVLTNIGVGDYIIRVTDANNCTQTTPLVLVDPTPPSASIINSDYCYNALDGATLEVEATDGLAPYQYNINGGAFQESPVFSNLTPGTYTIGVRDANGCVFTSPAESIALPVGVNTVLTKELDCTLSPEAIITGAISNGYPEGSLGYTYAVSINSGAYVDLGNTGTSFSYTASTAGTYTFRVTDVNSCESFSNVITVSPIELPTATVDTVNPSCNGSSNGSVQIIPAGGTGPYEYSFNGSVFNATSLYTGLSAGINYTYQVRDSKTCISNTGSITLTEPSILTANATVTDFSCDTSNGSQAGLITIDVPTTGTAPYRYSFDGGASFTASNTLTVNDDGTNQLFSYVVQDAQGCTTIAQDITIGFLNPPTDLVFDASAITCDNNTSTVNVIATNGAGLLEFETIEPSPIIVSKQTSNVFTGLTAGTYLFKVTDANGCYFTKSMTINPVTEIVATAQVANHVKCNGRSNGAIGVRVDRFTTTYSYSFNGGPLVSGQSNPRLLFTGLPAGVQTFVVTDDATGCTYTETVTVTEPASPVVITSAVATNVYCNEDNSEITITASGGTPGYRYVAVQFGDPVPGFGNENNGNVITVDTKGGTILDWGVYVIDSNNCVGFTRLAIVLDDEPTVTVPAVSLDQCNVSDGFSFTAVGTGIAPLSYSINGGTSYQSSPTFVVNTPGAYTVRIQDANGCIADSSNPIEIYEPLTTSAVLTKDITCLIGNEDAIIDVGVSGGNAPYTYKVKVDLGVYGPSTSITGSNFTFDTAEAGIYQFEITDANGCIQETNTIAVNNAINPEFSVNPVLVQSILCHGEETAEIEVIIDTTKGLAPFVINVFNDTESRDYGTQTSGLDAGTYTVTVTDAKGCTASEAITIGEPDPITLNFDVTPITCGAGGVSLGEIIINSVTGGTPNYTYHVTGVDYSNEILNQTGGTQIFEVVNFGLYEIIVTDANGCTLLEQDIKVASPPDDLDIEIATTVDCANGGEAEVRIGASSSITGAGPFYFAIYTGNGMIYDGSPVWQLGAGTPVATTFTNLLPDVLYTFIVYDDDTKCYYYETATTPIETNSTLSISGLISQDITCRGNSDGHVSFDITSIYNSPINITYQVFDAQSLAPVTPIAISGTGIVPANNTFSVSNLGPLDFGNYVVVIEETSGPFAGCGIATIPFNISESAVDLNLTASATRNQNCSELGVISAVTKDGTAPYEYQFLLETDTAPLATDAGWISANTFEGAAREYTVYVKDAYGCIQDVDVIIDLDQEPNFTGITETSTCFDGSGFDIEITGGIGVAPLTYSIGGAFQESPIFTLATAGSYSVTIKDGNGCTNTAPYTHIVETPLSLDVTATALDCIVNPAEFTFTTNGGDGTYTYEVSIDGKPYLGISLPYTTSTAGNYQFRVSDTQICQAESAAVIVEPTEIPTFTETHTHVTCNGDDNGRIVITATAGIGPFEYGIDDGTGVDFQNSNIFNDLPAGTYDIIVRDSKGCESVISAATQIEITEPSILVTTASATPFACNAANTSEGATITIDLPTTGTAPYSYSIDGSAYVASNTFVVYDNGSDQTIAYGIQDANGCSYDGIVTISKFDPPTDLEFSSNAVTCVNTTTDVEITSVLGGVAPLAYEIIAPASATGNTSGNSSGIYTGLTPDTYIFKVTDGNGCYYTESYTVDPVTNIAVRGQLANNVSCNADSNGAVGFRVSNYTSTYSYVINGGTPVTGYSLPFILVTGAAAGDQNIVVTDEVTGCTASFTVTINEPDALALTEIENINASCNFGARVTVEASGGTPIFEYAFVQDGVTPNTADYTPNASAVLDDVLNANWDVYVRDSNGCIESIDVVISRDALPSFSIPAITVDQCNASGAPFNFTVTGVSGVGPFSYSIGNGFQTSPTFSVTEPGNYFVTVRDGNGCTATSTSVVTVYPELDVSPRISAYPSCANSDGEITIEGAGGSGSYTYSVNTTGATISGNIISNLPAGTHTVTIEDTVTLCNTAFSVTIVPATPVTFTTVPTAVTCYGGNDGTITVNLPAANNNPIYRYSLDGGLTTQTSNVFSGLIAGTYNISVYSGRNCVLTQSETVDEPDEITMALPTVVEYRCAPESNARNFASITVDSVIGGSSNYTIYEFLKGGTVVQRTSSNTFTETDLLGGTYTITVYDDNGCIGITTAEIQPYIELEALQVVIDNDITCNQNQDISVLVTAIGGIPSLEYTLERTDGTSPSQVNTTGQFIGLEIGDYTIAIENLDTGCMLQTVHYVNDPNTFDITIDNVIDVTCFNDSDGSIDFTFIDRTPIPSDESGPFDYTIINAQNNIVSSGTTLNAGPMNVSGLPSGTYTLTASLTNTPFCSISKNFTISRPVEALSISENHTEISCSNSFNDGLISAIASGGWSGGYEFQLESTTSGVLSPFSTASDFSGLLAGDYTVRVRESKGCIASINVSLENPVPISGLIDTTLSPVLCFGDTSSSIEVTNISGGQGSNYTFILNRLTPVVTASGPQTSPIFTGLGAGTYSVSIQDGYGCAFTTAEVEITEPSTVSALLVQSTNETCTTGSSITLSASGGTGPYEYSDNEDFSSILGGFAAQVTLDFPQGTSGIYKYYVRDDNGCASGISNEIAIEPLPPLVVQMDVTNAFINCTGGNTGIIVAKAQGGLGNYIYTLQDGAGRDINPMPTQNSPGVFTDLPAGTYQVMVRSGNDCEVISGQEIIAEPALALQTTFSTTDVSCAGGRDGVLEIVATGGTGLIKYAISPQLNQFFESPIFEDLSVGSYQVVVQDELGCFVVLDFVIDEPTPVVLSIVPNSIVPELCSGDLDAGFSVTLTGGTLPYSYSIDDIEGTYTIGGATQTQFDFDNLSGGDHVVYVRDGAGCESEWNISLPESVLLNPQVSVDYGCTSNISTNTITVSIDDSITDITQVDYSLDGGPFQASNVFIDVPAGTDHFITARHTNGCEKQSAPFDIDFIEPLAVSIGEGQLNQIVTTVSGGVEPYNYTLNGEDYGNENKFFIYASGDYTVVVTDAKGCVSSVTQYFEYIDVCIPNYFTPNGDRTLDEWGPGCTTQYTDLTVRVFDRYGRQITLLHVNETWDGNYNGNRLPSGDYWYILKLNDAKDDREFVGHFTLYR